MKKTIARTRIVRNENPVEFQRELKIVHDSWMHLDDNVEIDIQYSVAPFGGYTRYTALVIAYNR